MDESKKTWREWIAARSWLLYGLAVGVQTMAGAAVTWAWHDEPLLWNTLPLSLRLAITLPHSGVAWLYDCIGTLDSISPEIRFAILAIPCYATLFAPIPWLLKRVAMRPFRWRGLGMPGFAQAALLTLYGLLMLRWLWRMGLFR